MTESKEENKSDDEYESPVEVFSLFANNDHTTTTSSTWMNISGCRKEVAVGATPIMCEIIGHGTGHNATSNHGALDFGINVNGSVHDDKIARGLAITHLDIWSNMTCHWVQELKPNTKNIIQLQIKSRDNSSKCAIWSPYLIIKLYKKINLNKIRKGNTSWMDISNLAENKKKFNINYEYRLSTGTGDSTIIPFKITQQYLYYYDIIEDSDDDEGEDDELIIAKIKYDKKCKILSKNKNYQKYVKVNRIQYKSG